MNFYSSISGSVGGTPGVYQHCGIGFTLLLYMTTSAALIPLLTSPLYPQ